MLAEVVEELKKTDPRAASPARRYAGPGDVECDFCTGRKHKAVKSCLVCLTSFCKIHLEPHLELPALKKHILIEASSKLQEKICTQHDKVFEIYCHTDQRCICSLCMLEDHKQHDVASLSTARAEKQSKLKEEKLKFLQRIQEKKKKVHELKEVVNITKTRAQTALEENEIMFTEMISFMEHKRSEINKLIKAREKVQLIQAEQLLDQLEQEITDIQRTVTEIQQLSHTNDHIEFLQKFQSLSISSESEDSPSIPVHQQLSFAGVRNSLSDLKKQLEEFCEEPVVFYKIPPHVAAVQKISASEPTSRKGFLKYLRYFTLDPKTVHHKLHLSEKNRSVTSSLLNWPDSDNPERFDSCLQVLCKESVCGRCYWELEYCGDVYVSVSYKEISRKGPGKECEFGRNSQSWSLWSTSSLSFFHDDIKTELGVPSPSRIGVYVDHSAGSLSFYAVSDTIRLIHRVHTTFTQPLYAGFGVYGGTVRLCDPK
ncbi:hypothetical protein HF521_013081 [Silurus meridionalis]|uniref:Tripartite motif-containing protein 16-like n=2 Tax=Silurus meridionalis TaxID=175797 RepID=A0A8T0AEV8_SILME|nr:hypothetical protein HF521_013081 [Silurus meridionalis]